MDGSHKPQPLPYPSVRTPKNTRILSYVSAACVLHLGLASRTVGEWRTTGRAIGMIDEELDAFADAFGNAVRTALNKRV